MKLTNKKIVQLFNDKGISNNEIKHNITAIRNACNEFKFPIDIFYLVFFNMQSEKYYTHSYGFHTREGRELINMFKDSYYQYEKKENSIFKQLKNNTNE